MAVDKSLTQAPMGLDALAAQEAPLQIEIVDPEEVRIGVDGMMIELGKEEPRAEDFDANLADFMGENELQSLASELLGQYETDLSSRKDWLDTYIKGLKILGIRYEERTEPWPGACGVFHPLLMESAVKFQSETIMETFPAMGPVKTKIIGKETPEKKDSAIRVADDMNYQLTEVMKEYRPEHERMLLSMALAGNAFKKVYFDPALNRQTAVYIPAEDIVVPYGAANLETADRVTHRMRKTKNDLRKLQYAGFYRDIDLGDPVRTMDEVEKQKAEDQGFSASMDDRFQLLEMHVNIDLPGYPDVDKDNNETGIALPYVVTIEKGTGTVLAIRRNWREDDDLKLKRQHFVHYGYIPGFGFYYFGLIHLIGGHSKAATSLLRQLIDAGTLSNLPGGLKSRGLRVKGDDTPIAPGEFRDVDVPSGAIRDNILPLPYKEPSQTLAMLMDKVVEEGRRFAAVSDLKISDMSSQAPVGTTLAILERVLKVMSAVQARIYYAMKQEFKLLAGIIRDNTPDEYSYEPEVGDRKAKKADYDDVDVIPVSDPNAATMSQKIVQYQAVLQLSQTAPQIYDMPYLHRQMIETLGIKNVQKIIPTPEDQKPVDPVTENMNVLNSKPVKAFLYQDHEAHLQVHLSAIQDPKVKAMVGQNPQAQQIMGAAMAHIMEHVAFQYRKEIEKQLGAALPPMPDDEKDETYLPEEVEIQVSRLSAQAAAKLLQKDLAEAQQQQAQQQAQDPIIQMQQQELQLRAQELQIKQQQLQIDAQLRQAELQRKQQEMQLMAATKADEIRIKEQEVSNRTQLDAARLGVDIQKHRTNLSAKQQAEGVRMGIDIAKHKDLTSRANQTPKGATEEE
ncbi:hypothetical protein EBT31_06995 [bacterium]|jgi:hypothetical protein|nr:hypothetical protein [bacterium]